MDNRDFIAIGLVSIMGRILSVWQRGMHLEYPFPDSEVLHGPSSTFVLICEVDLASQMSILRQNFVRLVCVNLDRYLALPDPLVTILNVLLHYHSLFCGPVSVRTREVADGRVCIVRQYLTISSVILPSHTCSGLFLCKHLPAL